MTRRIFMAIKKGAASPNTDSFTRHFYFTKKQVKSQ